LTVQKKFRIILKTQLLTKLSTIELSQTTIQDVRKNLFNPKQIAKNWDVILPSKNFLDTAANIGLINNQTSQDDFIICLAYGGNNHMGFFGNLESETPNRSAFFKTTETDGIDWVLYQRTDGKLNKIKTILRCKPSQNAVFTGSIFDHGDDVFALVTIAYSRKKLIRTNGDSIPLQKQYLYKFSDEGHFEICRRKNGTKLESKPYCKQPFDWRDPNPVLNFQSSKIETNSIQVLTNTKDNSNHIYFVSCGSDKDNNPCISNGKITFNPCKNPIIRKLKPTTNLPEIIYNKESVKTLYLECPQKVILEKSEVLICSAGVNYHNKILHFMVGYIKTTTTKKWQLVNDNGIIQTDYPLGFELYAAKLKIIKNQLVAIGWNAGPSGLPHSQSPYMKVEIDEELKTIKLV
jgi:hypothetical protein